MFITFEGIDGCGKSTQAEMLAEALRAEGAPAVTLLREPGGTAAAERIREILFDAETPLAAPAELLLFSAARADLVERQIRPLLESGGTVISDRFTDSTLAYQGAARGLDVEMIGRLNRFATGGLAPDLTIYLRLELDEAAARTSGNDRFEQEGRAMQQAVADAYDELARSEPNRVAVIDAAGTRKQVHSAIIDRVRVQSS